MWVSFDKLLDELRLSDYLRFIVVQRFLGHCLLGGNEDQFRHAKMAGAGGDVKNSLELVLIYCWSRAHPLIWRDSVRQKPSVWTCCL